MIDGHIHIEYGAYTLDWIQKFVNKAVEMQLDEISKHVLNKCGFEAIFEGLGDYQGEKREIFKSLWKK